MRKIIKIISKFFSRYHWWFAGLFAIASLIIGYTGFYKYGIREGESWSFLTIFYKSLQLFVLQSGDVKYAVPWELETARFAAPLTACYTAIRGLLLLFREQVYLARLRFYRNHFVICGLGRGCYNLALDLLNHGNRVVVIDKDVDNPIINNIRNRGGIVLIGEAIDSQMLYTVRIHKASRVLCFLDSDDDNIEFALLLDKIAGKKTYKGFPVCTIHIANHRLFKLFCSRHTEYIVFNRMKAVPLNINEINARAYFKFNPPDSSSDRHNDKQYHLVIVGFGQTGEAVTLRAVKTCHYSGNKKLRITIIDSQADYKARIFMNEYSNIYNVCDISFKQLNVSDPEFTDCSFIKLNSETNTVTRIIICFNNTEANLETALNMRKSLKDFNAEISVRISEEYGMKSLLETPEKAYKGISTFGDYKTIYSRDIILNHSLDVTAKTIHNHYVNIQLKQGISRNENPYLCSWEELPEEIKDSNRQQADHIEVKLRAAGCVITDNPSDTVEFTVGEIEILSKMEHNRWCAERYLAGWVHSPVKDTGKKHHTDLLPWDKIPETVREKDREAVRNIPELVRLAGKGITRE